MADPIGMLETQKIFSVRFNACGCIIDTPELDYEVKLGRRWRRVFLQPEQESKEAYHSFRSAFLKAPKSVFEVEAEFTGVFYQWMQGHRAPGLQFINWGNPKVIETDKRD